MGHQRSRTMDEWENGLQPALMEGKSGSSLVLPKTHARSSSHTRTPSGNIIGHARSPSGNAPGHARTWSRGSAFSASRQAMPAERQDGHMRSASAESKKQRRSSVLSLLSMSPKKDTQKKLDSPKKRDRESSSGSTPAMTPPVLPSGPGSPGSGLTSADGTDMSSQIMIQSGNHHSQNTNGGGFKSIIRPGKQKTSAFQEGIQNTTAQKAAESADKAGWLHKRGGSGIGVWSKRYFTLHGTRLSYFANFRDTKERGLIDITGHRVVPVKENDLLSLSAAGMGAGRHCFKLVPPGPGYKKGVAFTAPKVHYFAAESDQEMREWQTMLLTATIERDETAPVQSTCKLPTMSLPKAQELMAERLKTKGDIGSLIE